jgi:hypothetical protein
MSAAVICPWLLLVAEIGAVQLQDPSFLPQRDPLDTLPVSTYCRQPLML